MSLSGSLCTALTFGIGLFLAGCAEEPAGVETNDAGIAPEVGGVGALNDPSGTGGTNALLDTEYFPSEAVLLKAMHLPLFDDKEQEEVNPTVFGMFSAMGTGGLSTFKYAMGCALPRKKVITVGEHDYPGNGVLNTVEDWASGGLKGSAKLDVFACMAAHVNAYGEKVDIGLEGPSVSLQDDIGSDFTFQEAFWAAHFAADGTPVYDVWPLPDLEGFCGDITSESLKLRLCGNNPDKCNFMPHETTIKECIKLPDGVYCDGRPVIKTWLKADDAAKLHPRCALSAPGR